MFRDRKYLDHLGPGPIVGKWRHPTKQADSSVNCFKGKWLGSRTFAVFLFGSGPEDSSFRSPFPRHSMGLVYMPIRPGVVDWGSTDRQSYGSPISRDLPSGRSCVVGVHNETGSKPVEWPCPIRRERRGLPGSSCFASATQKVKENSSTGRADYHPRLPRPLKQWFRVV